VTQPSAEKSDVPDLASPAPARKRDLSPAWEQAADRPQDPPAGPPPPAAQPSAGPSAPPVPAENSAPAPAEAAPPTPAMPAIMAPTPAKRPPASAALVVEPPEPDRIRRPPDLMRLFFETMMIAVVLALADFGRSATSGLESDIHKNTSFAPAFLISAITVGASALTAIIPIGLGVERLLRRDSRRVADGVIAAALAYSIAYGLNLWILSSYSPQWLTVVLSRSLENSHVSPLHVYLASVIAFLTILGFGDRPTLKAFTWSCVAGYSVANLIDGESSVTGLMVTYLFGRTVAFGWRYLRGVPNDRPTGQQIVTALTAAASEPSVCRWITEDDDTRRYEVETRDGRRLDITVLDRDRQAVGLVYRIYRRIRLRGPAQRRNLISLRRTVDQEALMSFALHNAGIRTPRLIAVRELNADAAMMAYERVNGRTLEQLGLDELTDELLTRVWQVQEQLQYQQMAHRRLALDALIVDEAGEVWLTDLRNGEIAANQLQTRLDTAELMTALALRFGPERTVRAGVAVLGPDTIAAALPLLQPIALTRNTRTAVRKSKNLLQRIREQILTFRPETPAEPVKIERLRPRTLLSVVAGCLAAYLILSWFSNSRTNPLSVLGSASPWWILVAAAASVGTYAAAGMALTGFVPEKLPQKSTFLTQVAAGFVSMVAPAAVGGVALNTRYLQKQGIAPGPAVAAVGASQAVGFVLHITLIAVFGFIAGSSGSGHSSAPSTVLIAILLALALVIMIVLSVSPLRKFAISRLRPYFAGTLPRLLDVAQNPLKLAEGLGGTLLLSMMYAIALWASVQAVDPHSHISFATSAVVFLTAQAIGSIVPTPGGIGGVETAMSVALGSLGHLPTGFATSAVIVFRLLTCYLPVLPGWITFTYMQRKGDL
jgi:glycosyltransferase 2 family protein